MTYIVDGNNVMGQRVGWHRDRAGARRRLIADLARFAAESPEPVEVVFDGVADPDIADGSTVQGVQVHFSGRGADADSRIREIVAASPEPAALKVFTSDRRLADEIRQAGAQVIRSGELRRRLDTLAEADTDGTWSS